MRKTEPSQFISLLLPLILLAITSIILATGVTKNADFVLNDKLVKQFAQTLTPDPDIVIIDIDDYSLTQMTPYAGRWVWPRSVHGELIEGLSSIQPKAIAFDILFSEPDIYRPDADTYLNEVLSTQNNVYFAMIELASSANDLGQLMTNMPEQIGIEQSNGASVDARAHLLVPDAIDANNWRLGTINFTADSDGVGRSYDVRRNIDGWFIPSLPSKILEHANITLPEQDKIILQWRGATPKDFTTFSYVDIYQAIEQQNDQLLAKLNNKIIIIGSTATGLFDMRATPLSAHYPAVYMLATAIDNLKNSRFLTASSSMASGIVSFVCLTVIILLFLFLPKFSQQLSYAFVFVVLASILLIWISYQLLVERQILYVATPILIAFLSFFAFGLIYGFKEYLYRQRAISMFGRFLDPKVVSTLVNQGKLDLENTSKKAKITVLFTDIRSFTTLSEQYSAQEIVTLLNQYFDQQVKIIFAHQGTLDKFIGDCIMAFWGAPIANQYQEADAINAALSMEEHLQQFRQSLSGNFEHFDVGIGIHTGEAIVGMVGAEQRVDYTAIGDTVNLASRIEGLTKDTARILVSQQTMQACKDEFNFIYQGEFTVKGRSSAVKLYQPTRKLQ